jgi:hypothetical protein
MQKYLKPPPRSFIRRLRRCPALNRLKSARLKAGHPTSNTNFISTQTAGTHVQQRAVRNSKYLWQRTALHTKILSQTTHKTDFPLSSLDDLSNTSRFFPPRLSVTTRATSEEKPACITNKIERQTETLIFTTNDGQTVNESNTTHTNNDFLVSSLDDLINSSRFSSTTAQYDNSSHVGKKTGTHLQQTRKETWNTTFHHNDGQTVNESIT